jgi:hypothetical protein
MPHRGVRTASTLACRGGAHSGAHEAGIAYEVYRTIVGKGVPEDAVARGRSRDRPSRTARCAQTGHRSDRAPVRPCSRPEAIDVPVGLFYAHLFYAAHRYIHRSGGRAAAAWVRAGAGARTAPHSGAPPPVASNPSYQACTFSLPGQVRQNPASARLPRLVARGYTGLAVTGLLSVSSFYDGSAGL